LQELQFLQTQGFAKRAESCVCLLELSGKLPEAKLKIAVKFIHDNKELIAKMKETMGKL